MLAYSPTLPIYIGLLRRDGLVVVKEQIQKRIGSLEVQKRIVQENDAFIDQKRVNALTNRIAELDLLLEAMEKWIEQ